MADEVAFRRARRAAKLQDPILHALVKEVRVALDVGVFTEDRALAVLDGNNAEIRAALDAVADQLAGACADLEVHALTQTQKPKKELFTVFYAPGVLGMRATRNATGTCASWVVPTCLCTLRTSAYLACVANVLACMTTCTPLKSCPIRCR